VKYAEYFAKKDMNDGKYIGFYSNGKKSVEGFFKDDEKVGEWLYFYPDGTIEDKSYYVEGEVYGFQFNYDVAGKLNFTNYIKDEWGYYRVSYDSSEQAIDTLHYVTPVSTVYYSLNVVGDTTFISPLAHNELHGVGKYNPGKISSYDVTYNEGDLDKDFEIKDVLGRVSAKKSFVLGEIQSNIGYNGFNGKVTYKGSYKEGDLHGIEYDYYPDGSIRVETNYVDGEEDGATTWYAPDGNVVLVMMYDEGILVSYGENAEKQNKVDKPVVAIKYNYDNGKPKVDITLKYGSFDGEWKIYNKNGTIGESRQYKLGNKNGVDTLYNKNGEILKIVPYKGGDTYGEVVEYDGKGKIIRRTNYLNDEKHGWEFYYKNGNLFKSFYYYNGDPIIEK
jgi:antitoxin component YwqK of YwqJK toxin-antitoxin module